MATNPQDEQRLALFIDFENIAIGVRDAKYSKFEINLVLERLSRRARCVVKRAYADWSRYSDYKRSFHEAAIELIEVPQKSVRRQELGGHPPGRRRHGHVAPKEHIDVFVVASGDSDFSPLVSKLKENNKYVIGLGVKNSTSDLLIENCDEFIFYEDLVRGQQRPMAGISNLPEKVQECFSLLIDAVLALQRENKEVLWGSMVKQTMKRKKPSFNETYYGFRTFSHLLEDAQRRGIVLLRRDQKSGSYVVEDLGSGAPAPALAARAEVTAAVPARLEQAPARLEGTAAAAAAAPAEAGEPAAAANGLRPRRRRSRSRRPRGVGGAAPETTSSTPLGGADEGPETDDDQDLGEDELSAEGPNDEGEAAHPSEEGSGRPEEGAPAEKPKAAGAPEDPQPEPAEGDRPFSIFSWLRRDTDPHHD